MSDEKIPTEYRLDLSKPESTPGAIAHRFLNSSAKHATISCHNERAAQSCRNIIDQLSLPLFTQVERGEVTAGTGAIRFKSGDMLLSSIPDPVLVPSNADRHIVRLVRNEGDFVPQRAKLTHSSEPDAIENAFTILGIEVDGGDIQKIARYLNDYPISVCEAPVFLTVHNNSVCLEGESSREGPMRVDLRIKPKYPKGAIHGKSERPTLEKIKDLTHEKASKMTGVSKADAELCGKHLDRVDEQLDELE